jgi:hypothetical protein
MIRCKKIFLWILLLAAPLCFVIGCGPADKAYNDVTSSPRYNFSSFAGTTWKTKVNVAIADIKNYRGHHELSLLVPKHFDIKDPEYTPGDDCKIIAVMPVGTHLRIERLMQDNGGEWGGVKVLAIIQDGTNSRKTVFLDEELLAKNSFITSGDSPSTAWDVNPEMLEK